MRVVFMGTPSFAVPSLAAVAERHEVTLVVTRPDAVRSRGKRLEPSPVKEKALELGLPVLEASRIREDQLAAVRAAAPDVICVAAYGCILPDDLLAVAPMGAVNVHASLLPRWRGAAPIQRAILAGDERAGVSIMRVAHDLDAGTYCRQASVEVGSMNTEELTAALADLGARELVTGLDQMRAGTAVWEDQDESQVTYAHKVDKAEMLLDPEEGAEANVRRVRASSGAAPARALVCGRGLRVTEARVAGAGVDAVAGAAAGLAAGAVAVAHGRVALGCADGALELVRVKPDGKREMDASAWAAGLRDAGRTWQRA